MRTNGVRIYQVCYIEYHGCEWTLRSSRGREGRERAWVLPRRTKAAEAYFGSFFRGVKAVKGLFKSLRCLSRPLRGR